MKRKNRNRCENPVETLERRLLMAVIAVLNDDDVGVGTLRDAIVQAQDGDSIDLTAVSGTVALSSELTIDKTLTLLGPGADELTINGGDASRLFNVASGNILIASDLTLAHGNASNGGAILNAGTVSLVRCDLADNTSTNWGGAIYQQSAALSLTDCRFTGNAAAPTNFDAFGGAIFSQDGSLTANGCTFDHNSATGGSDFIEGGFALGGAIAISGNVSFTMTNCTVTNNTTQGGTGEIFFEGGAALGGGLYLSSNGGVVITNCTIADNSAISSQGGFGSYGGGVDVASGPASYLFTNTIIAKNTAESSPDIFNPDQATSGGGNLIGQAGSGAFVNAENGDQVGTSESPLDPMLADLADNGGNTPTRALLEGSPAVNTGTATAAPETDQRGVARGALVDIGAFEYVPPNHAPAFVSTAPTTATADAVYTYDVAASDIDGDHLALSATSLPDWLTLTDHEDGTASLTGTPSNADAGGNAVSLQVTDGSDMSTQSFEIQVAAVNHAPAFSSTAITEASAESAYTYDVTTTDADGDDLEITAPEGGLPNWLTLLDNGDGTATLSGTPSNADQGENDIALNVSDGADETEQDFTITVGAVNHDPVFSSTPITAAAAGSAYSYNVTATDSDTDALTISAPTLPAWLTLTDNGNGTAALTGTPGINDVGIDEAVTLEVSDGTRGIQQAFSVLTAPPPAGLKLDGTLNVIGGAGNDDIHVWLRQGPSAQLRVALNGAIKNYNPASVTRIQVFSGDGDDTVLINCARKSGYVYGGNGNDTISGGEGDDTLTGGAGRDSITGNGGADRLKGSGSADRIFGNNGNDVLLGSEANDTLDGGLGNDLLRGEDGNDLLLSLDGVPDTLIGGAGSNSARSDPLLDTRSDIETLLN